MKHRVVHVLQKYAFNPPVRALLALGFVPPSYSLLETIGQTTGLRRTTPVGNGLEGDTFWIVAEHGLKSGYVRNVQRNPRVRVKVRDRGTRSRWRNGSISFLRTTPACARSRSLVASPDARLTRSSYEHLARA